MSIIKMPRGKEDEQQQEKQQQQQRLPVNPRRHKVPPAQRKRVAQACNSCNLRRTRCSGETPCSQCAASSRECVYPGPSAKVFISRTELDDLKRRVEAYERALQDVMPDDDKRKELVARQGSFSTPSETSSASASQQRFPSTSPSKSDAMTPTDDGAGPFSEIEGRLLHDNLGTARFHGETGEKAFVDSLNTFLRGLLPTSDLSTLPSSVGRCETSDSRPLPSIVNVDPRWLPPPNTTRTMLSVLRSFIQDGSDDRPSPTGGIYWWGDLRSVPSATPSIGHVEADIRNARRLAFYQTALGLACRIVSTGAPAVGQIPDRSEQFFARATALLGNPLDVSRPSVGEVSVLTLMAFFLLESDRKEAASVYISVAVRLSAALGVTQGFVEERGKRIFWTLYVLDRWLSYLLGRPPTILDEAIQLPLPADAPSLPPAAGLKAHISLSRISGQIVSSQLYHPSPWRQSGDDSVLSTDTAISMLDQWLHSLPQSLRLSPEGLSNDAATCMLHMHHNQLNILALRPSLLSMVKNSLLPQSPSSSVHSNIPPSYARDCLAAAERNMRLGRHVATLHRPRRLLHTGLHFIFNAVLCFFLQSLTASADDGSSAAAREVKFAIELFDREAQTGNMYGMTCSRVLQELQSLAARVQNRSATPMDVDQVFEEIGQSPAWHALSSSSASEGGPVPESSGDAALFDEVVSWMEKDWAAYNMDL